MFPGSRFAMLSSDDHSGLIAFLVGLIILVFAAIILSMAVDRRFRFSSNHSALEAEIRKTEAELEGLRSSHLQRSWRLLELEPERAAASAALTSLEKSGADMERHEAALVAERARLVESIPAMEEVFARYREKYRAMVREVAIGESLGVLTTLSGREYRETSIMRVTDTDLEIRHTHGSARIAASDLGPAWRDRFHWDEEASMVRVATEGSPRQTVARPPEAAVDVAKHGPGSSDLGLDSRKAATLRGKVILWRAKVSQLRQERSRALSSADGSQASVPGSLETWQVKAERLGAELQAAEAELAAAEAAYELALQR